MKKNFQNKDALYCLLGILFSFCACFYFYSTAITGDAFFMVAQARDILSGGLFTQTDPVSMHAEYSFLHQKWLMCLLTYFVYENFGINGLRIGVFVMSFFANIGLFFLLSAINKKNRGLNFSFLFAASPVISFFSDFKPQLISILFFMWELYLLEKYASDPQRNRAWKLYFFMFLISVLTMWFHSTMWYLCLIFPLPYLCDSKILEKFFRKCRLPFVAGEYDKKPILISIIVLIAGSLFQPNGIKEYKYLYSCITITHISKYVGELRPLFLLLESSPAAKVILLLFCLFAGFLFLHWKRKRKISIRVFFIFCGAAVLSFVAVRLCLYSVLLLSFACAIEVSDKKLTCHMRLPKLILAGAMLFYSLTGIEAGVALLSNAEKTDEIQGVFCGEAFLQIADTEDFFFSDSDMGSYLECLGLKAWIDDRTEIYDTNDLDLLVEYKCVINGKKSSEELKTFRDEWNFSYFVLNKASEKELTAALWEADWADAVYEDGSWIIFRTDERETTATGTIEKETGQPSGFAKAFLSFRQTTWASLKEEERKEAILSLAELAAEDLEITEIPSITYYESEDLTDYGGYLASKNEISVNLSTMEDAKETADTILHEMRHCFQHQDAQEPEASNAKEESYIFPQEDFLEYQNQPAEVDAREYAASVLEANLP